MVDIHFPNPLQFSCEPPGLLNPILGNPADNSISVKNASLVKSPTLLYAPSRYMRYSFFYKVHFHVSVLNIGETFKL